MLMLAAAANAEIIDRIAVTVGDGVITVSDIDRHIRLSAMFSGEKPDLSVENRREHAEKLVEQLLMQREMKSGIGMEMPEEPDPQFSAILKARYPTDEAYAKALLDYDVTHEAVRGYLLWLTMVNRFIDVRFRPGVHLREPELRDYYENTWIQEYQRNHGGKAPPLEEARAEVEDAMLADRANHALDRWLGEMRTQTRIRFREEAFRP